MYKVILVLNDRLFKLTFFGFVTLHLKTYVEQENSILAMVKQVGVREHESCEIYDGPGGSQSSFNFHSPVLTFHSTVTSSLSTAMLTCSACCFQDGHFGVAFCDGCDYTTNRGRKDETFSFPCVRKSGFFGSGIVRLGYDRIITFIFITNSEPPIGAD